MEQRNSIQFIILTFVISIALISIAFGIFSGISTISAKEDTAYFGENTYVGPIRIDGLTKEQALAIVSQETEQWKSKQQSIIQFVFDKVKTENSLVDFDVNTSVSKAESGKTNQLFASFNEQNVVQVMDELGMNDQEEIDFESFKFFLLEHASNLSELPKTIHLTDYFLEQSEENIIFSAVTIDSQDHDISYENWARKNNEIAVVEGSVFSLNVVFQNETDALYTDEFKNELSSAIYKAALNSPFSIVERYITTDNRYGQEVGYEAYIDTQHDLKIKNESGQLMKIVSVLEDGKLTVSVEGPSSPIRVKSSIREKVTLKPRIIVYPVENISDEYEVEGEDGIQVTVVRAVTIGGSHWKTYTHTVDSYLPTPEKWYRVFEEDQEE